MNTYQVLTLLLSFGCFLISFIEIILKIIDSCRDDKTNTKDKNDKSEDNTNEVKNKKKKHK